MNMMSSKIMAPLSGIKVVEFAGLAPGPYCGRILADWGASIVRVDRPHGPDLDRLSAGKRSIIVNSKRPEGVAIIQKLCGISDVLIDPYRPGVLERLGLGPEPLLAANPRLIYARITGYGQTGPLKHVAGHDINYMAMSGILSTLGRQESVPTPPINLLADFAGGGFMAAFGVAMALMHRNTTGRGQVVDCSMTEGAAYVGSWLYNMKDRSPIFGGDRGANMLDSGSHFYDTYETSDGRYMAVGAVEPQFYATLLDTLGLDREQVPQFGDFEELKKVFKERFKSHSFAHWTQVFEGTDACVTPVLSLDEAPVHPHHQARHSFVREGADTTDAAGDTTDGAPRYTPSPAPLLSESPARSAEGLCYPSMGQHTQQLLQELGYSDEDITRLTDAGVVLGSDTPIRGKL